MSVKSGVYPVYENQFQVGEDKENPTICHRCSEVLKN